MKPRKGRLLVLAVCLVFACSGCATDRTPETPAKETQKVGLPNPASVHCIEQGGTLEIRKGPDGGERGFCLFQDGSECEEWALFRGECSPGR